MYMRRIKILSLLLLTSIPLIAGSGSVYSRYGFGDLRTSFSARRLGMGELGFALSDNDYLSALNPASWSGLRLTRFEASLLYSGFNSQNSASSVYHNNVDFNGMMFGFPIDHDLGISFALGIVPYSEVNYEITQVQNDPLVDPYNLNYKGNGGISKIFFGGSYRLPFDFSLGVTYDYYNGRIEHSAIAEFDPTSSFHQISFTDVTNYHGMSLTTGLISNDLSKYFGSSNFKDFRIGIVFTPAITMSTDSVDNASTSIGTLTNATGSIKTKFPYKLGIGTTFKYTDSYTFTIDYAFQPFSEFTSNGITTNNMQNYYKMGLGFEYRNSDTRSNAFWDHVMLRAGLSYEQSPFKINGTGINQFSVYGGFSLPISYDNTIDFAFQYGRRGTTDNSLVQENIYKFTITLSIGDIWFVRTDR